METSRRKRVGKEVGNVRRETVHFQQSDGGSKDLTKILKEVRGEP